MKLVQQILNLPRSPQISVTVFLSIELLANASGWLFTTFAARSLSIQAFGHIGFIANILFLFALLSLSIRIASNRYFAEALSKTHNTNLFGQVSMLGVIAASLGVLFSIVLIVSAFWWTQFFSVPYSTILLAAIAFHVLTMFSLAWLQGIVLAKESYLTLSVVLIIEVFVKLSLVVVASMLASFTWFLIAMTAPVVLSFFLLTLYLHVFDSDLRNIQPAPISNEMQLFIVHTLFLRIGVILLATVDLVLIKSTMTAENAGVYALLVVVGKVILFFAQSLYSILVPLISVRINSTHKQIKVLITLLGLLVAFASTFISAILLFPNYTLAILLGPKYVLIYPYVLPYACAITLLAVSMIISLYFALVHEYRFSICVALALVLEVVLMRQFGTSIASVTMVMLLVSLSLLVLCVVMYARRIQGFVSRITRNYVSTQL